MNDEFYIGWEDQAAPGIKRFVRSIVWLLLAIGLGAALSLAAMQRTIGVSVFEWGTVKPFSRGFET